MPIEPVEPKRVIFFAMGEPPFSAVEHRGNDHGHEGRNEHDAVEPVQDSAVAREDGAVVLDAALTLDHAGEQVAVDAQHRGHHAQQPNDDIHGNSHVGPAEHLHPVGGHRVDHGGQDPEEHGAQHPADGPFHRLFGAHHRAELVFAEGPACKIGAGVPAPGKAEDQQDEKDRVIIKSNGEYTYLLPDIAYHVDKFNRGYDKLIDLFGADHHGYINRMKSALRLLGYDDSRLDIELTQMVRILRGDREVKLSKREGTADTLRSLVEEVGVDACRYFFVSRAPSTHLDLNLDLMTTKNNTNPSYYASYAHARLCSVLNQAEDIDYLNAIYSFADEAAISLIKKLMEFNDVVEDAAKSLAPHKVCAYVQKLAQLIHVFYTECRIINKDDMENSKSRLALCQASKIVLRKALELIGVNAPEKM